MKKNDFFYTDKDSFLKSLIDIILSDSLFFSRFFFTLSRSSTICSSLGYLECYVVQLFSLGIFLSTSIVYLKMNEKNILFYYFTKFDWYVYIFKMWSILYSISLRYFILNSSSFSWVSGFGTLINYPIFSSFS